MTTLFVLQIKNSYTFIFLGHVLSE